MDSKVELQSELDYARIVARRDDAAEIAGTEHLSRCRIDAATRGNKSIQVADGIGEIRMVEEVEKVSAKFEGPRFRDRKKLCERKVQINLPWAAQAVSPNVTYVDTSRAGRRGSTGTWDDLA